MRVFAYFDDTHHRAGDIAGGFLVGPVVLV
jgi:hypothetical protein